MELAYICMWKNMKYIYRGGGVVEMKMKYSVQSIGKSKIMEPASGCSLMARDGLLWPPACFVGALSCVSTPGSISPWECECRAAAAAVPTVALVNSCKGSDDES